MNENCLKGISCINCGSTAKFEIQATAVFTVTDDGTEEYRDVEWGPDSICTCMECGCSSTIRENTV